MSIVVCTPGGAAGDVLLAAGERQARQAGAQLVLLRRVKLHDVEHAAAVDRGMSAVEDVRAQLDATAREVSARGVACRAEVLTSPDDNPGPDLLDAVSQADGDLVIIGLRPRSRVGKFLLGSTTQDLLLGAGRPVLCVPVD